MKSRELKSSIVKAIKAGIQEWSGFVYNIKEIGQGQTEDITVALKYKTSLGGQVGGIVNFNVDCNRNKPTIAHAFVDIATKFAYAPMMIFHNLFEGSKESRR